jgi:GNAT superfamily N-acetyltransferase
MLSVDWLEKQMDKCDTMAEWLYRQFSYEYAEQSLSDWQHEFAEGQLDGRWKSLIATEHGQLLGGAALASADLSTRPDLGPWLACVFVTPEARGRGIAEQLIEGICNHARDTGVATLYLHTQDKSAYYAKRGWEVLERFESWDNEQWLMSRDLQ